MRQAGILAAAGLYAINNNINRLAEDHVRAKRLAQRLLGIEGLTVQGGKAHTNMVYLALEPSKTESFLRSCADQGLLFSGAASCRLVIHNGVDDKMVERAISIISGYFDA